MSSDPIFPEILLDMYRAAESCLIDDIGLSRNEAGEAAKAIIDHIWSAYAGCQVYIPVGRLLKMTARNQAIYAASMAGVPKVDILREYRISNATYYGVLRCGRHHLAAAQLELFQQPSSGDNSDD